MEETTNTSPTIGGKEKKKKSKLRRIIKWSLIGFSSLLFLLAATAFIIIYFFEDDIKKYAIDQINKEVNTKIEVRDIELSLFKKFPMASLEFKDVKCLEVTENEEKGNLLVAKSIFLEFSIWDIFKGKYKFKKLSVENGELNLKIDKQGRNNFNILKKKKPGEQKKKKDPGFQFNAFILKNVHFSLVNRQENQEYRALIKKLHCSGAFTEKTFTLKAKASILSELISINHEDFATNKNFNLNTTLEVNQNQKQCNLKNANLELENMKLELKGAFKYDSTAAIDLAFDGQNLNIQSFLSLLPSNYKNFEKKYKSQGAFYLKGSIRGSMRILSSMHVAVDFGIQQGKIKFIEENIEMKNINLVGSFNTGADNSSRSTELKLDKFEGKLDKSAFAGKFYLKDLEKPRIKFEIDADVDLEEVFRFIPVEKIEHISGRVKTKLIYDGQLEGNSFTLVDFKNSTSNGNAVFENVGLKIKEKPLGLSNCSGEVIFENTQGTIPRLTGKIANTQFSLHGKATNLPEYFYLENYPLIIEANITCDKILVEDFMTGTQGKEKKKNEKFTLDIPANIDLALNANIQELSFKKFKAGNIAGLLILKNKKLYTENLRFESCGGTADISGSVNTQDPENIVTQAYGSFNKISISTLFTQFENFSQHTLEDKHLKGTTQANIAYSATFDHELKMKLNTLYVNAPLEITNGELIDFKPLEGLSKFIRVEELRHIKFSTLSNTIEIKDEAIVIPKMVIQSNALNLEIGGVHYFDNRIEYYFNVYLKDLLAAKWKKKRKTEDEFGEIIEEEGGARIYLKMSGTMDKYTITIDKKGVKEKIKEDVKKEGQTLKQIFYEEFGAFKNDSTVKKSTLLPPKKIKKNKVDDSQEFDFE
jgi:hypothetical protein